MKLLLASFALVLLSSVALADTRVELTLLGTAGGPGGKTGRAGIASLVTIGDKHYLIDAGEGVSRQLAFAGVRETSIETVFLTHLHDDHTAGLPGLVTFAHTMRSSGMTILGPPGTERLVSALLQFLDVNAEIRIAESRGNLKAPESLFSGKDLAPGEVFTDGDLRVTAVENTHFRIDSDKKAHRNQSWSYRFDTPSTSIVFTGDTGPSTAVEALAKDADILVTEMASAADIENVPPYVREHMLEEHLTSEEVGKLASRANVGRVILSHIGTVTDEDVAGIRRHFGGPIDVGADLDRY